MAKCQPMFYSNGKSQNGFNSNNFLISVWPKRHHHISSNVHRNAIIKSTRTMLERVKTKGNDEERVGEGKPSMHTAKYVIQVVRSVYFY